MLDTTTLEERLLILEAEVAALKQRAMPSTGSGNWLEKLGSMADEPGFEKVLEYGRAFRNSDRPTDLDEAS